MRRVYFLCLVLIFILHSVTFAEKLNFRDLSGRWQLLYRGNYGYEFRLFKNYRAVVILYLRSHALIFKGVYTIEEGDKIRINISQMKNQQGASGINMGGKFVKAASSYFIFKAERDDLKKKKFLVLKPVKIIIDGRSSEGYFEPLLKLKRI